MNRFLKTLGSVTLSISLMSQYCIPMYASEIEDIESLIEKVEIQERENTQSEVKIDVTFIDDTDITSTKLNVRGLELIEIEDYDIDENVYTYTYDFEVGDYEIESLSLTYLDEEYEIDLKEKELSFCVEESIIEDESVEEDIILEEKIEETILEDSYDSLDGSTFENAISLSTGLSSSYSINGSLKYFSFTPNHTGFYTLESIGNIDTFGILYDTAYNQLTNDDDSGNGYNFLMKYKLDANITYYLGIRMYSSSNEGSTQIQIEEYQPVTSGSIGSNLSWSVNEDVLTISGSGDMNLSTGTKPWNDIKDMIHTIIIENGVTNISNGAFYGLKNVNQISISSSVKTIGDNAFNGCTSLQAIDIPAGVESIGDLAFQNCSQLESVTFEGAQPTFGDNAFLYCNEISFYILFPDLWDINNYSTYGASNIVWYAIQNAVDGYSLTLYSDIGVNFYFQLAGDVINDPNAYVLFTHGNKSQMILVSDAQIEYRDGNKYYRFTCHLSAKEMTDTISAKLYSNNSLILENSFCIDDYANYIYTYYPKESADYQNMKTMMTYGYYAQDYFGYTLNQMTSQINSLHTYDLSNYAYTLNDQNDAIDFIGARLILGHMPGLKLYFIGDGNFKVNGKDCSVSKEGTYTVLTIDSIDSIFNMYTVTANQFSIRYGILSYGNSIVSSHSKLTGLMEAMIEYYCMFDDTNLQNIQKDEYSSYSIKKNLQLQLQQIDKQLDKINDGTAKKEYDAKVASGSLGFYQWMYYRQETTPQQRVDAYNAIQIINAYRADNPYANPNLAYTYLGNPDDATNIFSMMNTKDYIEYGNRIRVNENGLNALGVNMEMMAYAQIQANASSVLHTHSMIGPVAENITLASWILTPQQAYEVWYYSEKRVYDYLLDHPDATKEQIAAALNIRQVDVQTGHYENIIRPYGVTGYAYNHYYDNTRICIESQVFTYSSNVVYDVDSFFAILQEYMDTLKDPQTQYNELMVQKNAIQNELKQYN